MRMVCARPTSSRENDEPLRSLGKQENKASGIIRLKNMENICFISDVNLNHKYGRIQSLVSIRLTNIPNIHFLLKFHVCEMAMNLDLRCLNSPSSLKLPKHLSPPIFLSVMANPTNVLSSGIEITGSIRFSNDMIIDGKIEGEITSDKGKVTIGENATVNGDISAGEVKVYGKVEGKITSQRCELKDKSRINGDIKSKVFSMEEGAALSGRTEIGG